MTGVDALKTHFWSIEELVGFSHPFLRINSETVIHTWIILAILFTLLLLIRFVLLRNPIGRYLAVSYVEFFINLTKQSLGTFVFNHFAFINALFLFILFCNVSSLIPWIEEPTRDLNTTLALGIISFIYTQTVGIRSQGLWNYIKDFFKPIFIFFPLNVIGKLSSIVSISFRLFGNIFGGSIISGLYFGAIKGSWLIESVALFSGLNFAIIAFFTIFEGGLQAFVFAMLSLTYISLSLQGEGH
jgi:F-type H+-transporting ATPase subunit a